MKNNKGITIVALVITIIILILISSVTVSIGTGMVETAKFENIETYLLLIQSSSKMMAEKVAMGEIEETSLRGTKQSGGQYDGLYKLSQSDLDEIGAKKANANDGYYVDYANNNVIYAKGVSFNDKTYYKLSDILSDTE